MRIERLDLLSYGHLRDQTIDLSAPPAGVTLVLGPNEAGKSTTMRAMTALLFGIERGTPDHHGRGRESLRVGARLRDGEDGALEVVRQGLARAPLIRPDGESIDPSLLTAMLGGVERALFAALFCIDHDELHERSSELLDPDAEIGRLIFGASLGATTLIGVLKDLEARADALYRPQGSRQRVAMTLTRARELVKQVRESRVRSREWEQAEEELTRLERDVAGLRETSGRLRGEENRLQRLRAELPHAAKRSEMLSRIAELRRDGSPQGAEWAAAVEHTQDALREARAEQGRAQEERDTLEGRIAALPVSKPLLIAAERIDAALEGVGRFRKDRQDLPGLEGELAAARERLAGQLERLGMTEAAARGVTDPQLAVVADLTQARAGIDERIASAERELQELDADTAEKQRILQGLPGALDVGLLRRVVAVARPLVDRERTLGSERVAVGVLADDIATAALRLSLGCEDLRALEELPAPSAAALREHRRRLDALQQRRAGLRQRVADLEQREAELSARRDEIAADASVPDLAALSVTRERRDVGWKLIRAAWLDHQSDEEAIRAWAGDLPLADAFEASSAEADRSADDRYAHATQLAMLEQVGVELAGLAERRTGLQEEALAVEAEAALHEEEWRTLWATTGVCPSCIDEGHEWLDGLAEIRQMLAEYRRRSAALDELVDQVQAQRDAVVREMRRLRLEVAGDTLALAIEQADEVIEQESLVAEARRAAQQALDDGTASRPRRERALANAQKALAEWQTQWSAAICLAGAAPETGLAAGREILAGLRAYRAERSAADTLQGRVTGLRGDIDRYQLMVKELAAEVAPELAGEPAERALAEIKPRLDTARQDARLRAELTEQLEEASERLAAAQLLVQESEHQLQQLREQAELAADADLSAEAQRGAELAHLRAEVDGIGETMVGQGGGLTLEELLSALGEVGGEDELVARLEGVRADIEDVDDRLGDANRRVGEVRTRIAALDHAGSAAALEQDAELEFAALADHVSEYARVALARSVLNRVIADYGQRHQTPILQRAAHNFSVLTDGAFDDLIVDLEGDRQLLLAKRRNGEVLHLTALSDGTLDQLYLALRLAGLAHHLDRSEKSPPVILDDLLVNFDDVRAAAALRLLAELGGQAQVLLFTHHTHICRLAEATLDSAQVHVAELGARNHAAPLDIQERQLAKGRSRGQIRESEAGAQEQTITAVLDDASEPLGKAEILSRTGISDAGWTRAIRSLLDSGTVEQLGTKRGARYRLRIQS